MIGYLQPVSGAKEIRQLYRSYQCGLCHTLSAEYGFHYRVFAQPDLVFYNVFMDLCGDGAAQVEHRACPLVPVVSRYLPVRARTDHTRFTAAFGVYMAVEKLKDDWLDEGSRLKWLLWKVYEPGQRKARAVLEDAGFPVVRVEGWMREQARIEGEGPLPLEDARVPTVSISRTLFRHAARDDARAGVAAAIGERIGAFLFYMDNLLDFGKDVREGGYNALARLSGEAELGDELAAAGISAAEAQVGDLEKLVPALGVGEHAGYLRDVLVTGFRLKVKKFRELDAGARAKATLRDLRPARVNAVSRARLVVAATVLMAFPNWAWAQHFFVDTGDTGRGDPETGWDRMLDACYCRNACEGCCGDPCEDVCGDACDDVCDDACDVDCGDSCSC